MYEACTADAARTGIEFYTKNEEIITRVLLNLFAT